MVEFSCQMYIGTHASFNPVLARTGVKKVAKLNHITHKELIEPSMRQLLAAFESLPHQLSI